MRRSGAQRDKGRSRARCWVRARVFVTTPISCRTAAAWAARNDGGAPQGVGELLRRNAFGQGVARKARRAGHQDDKIEVAGEEDVPPSYRPHRAGRRNLLHGGRRRHGRRVWRHLLHQVGAARFERKHARPAKSAGWVMTPAPRAGYAKPPAPPETLSPFPLSSADFKLERNSLERKRSAQTMSEVGGRRAPCVVLPTGNPFVCRSGTH